MIAPMPPAQPGEHRNVALIRKLYAAIQNADPEGIIACYRDDAYFEDIAFQREGKAQISEMWQLVCHSRPRVTIDFDAISADDQKGTGRWMATYMFGKTKTKPGRRVDNTLTSEFVFRDGLIAAHHDRCHAMAWAVQAIVFPVSLLVGSITPLRRRLAEKRLEKFIEVKSAAGAARGAPSTRGAKAMAQYTSGGQRYNITFYPGPDSTKTYPLIVLLHGNGAFIAPYGKQIHDFAEALAALGYVAAVPGYYLNDVAPPIENPDRDPRPHVPKLADAIAEAGKRKDVDLSQLGLIGYSLGAAVAMRYIGKNPGKAKVLADFFGPIDPTIEGDVGSFPPTIIFHTSTDHMVLVINSTNLHNRLVTAKVKCDPPHIYPPEPGQFMDHAFRRGGHADTDSQKRLIKWFDEHLPPKGT